MRLRPAFLALAMAAGALALSGCDRRDQKPMNTAAQQAAPEARKMEPSGPPPDATRAEQSVAAPKPDSNTRQEPPVQGQADARQGEQKQHFDNKR